MNIETIAVIGILVNLVVFLIEMSYYGIWNFNNSKEFLLHIAKKQKRSEFEIQAIKYSSDAEIWGSIFFVIFIPYLYCVSLIWYGYQLYKRSQD